MNLSDKGSIAEQKATLAFMQKGYQVFSPVGEGYPSDLIVADANNVYRCQVKRTRIENGALRCKTSKERQGGGYFKYTNIDLFVFYWPEDDQLYVLHGSDSEGRTNSLRVEDTQRQDSRTRWAEEFKLSDFAEASLPREKAVPKDNRRQTQEVICSNCAETFRRKASKIKDHMYCSRRCFDESREVIDWPPTPWLKRLVSEYSYLHLSRKLGVSDNAIRKRIDSHA